MAGSGGEENVSMDDSDRENFRRRGRGPASKRAGGGRERGERDEHEFVRMSERGDNNNGRRERSPAVPNRGGNSREIDRTEHEFARGAERRDNGRRGDRSPGSIGRGSHERERDEDNKRTRVSEWENNGRRRERSPGSRRREAERVISRDRERSGREYGRGSERRDDRRKDRSPAPRRAGSREGERGDNRYARAPDRGDHGRRDRRGNSTDRGHGLDDFGRGAYRQGNYKTRDGSPRSRLTDRTEKSLRVEDEFARGGFERGNVKSRDRSPGSNDGSIERDRTGAKDRYSDLDSPQQGIKGITRNRLSPGGQDLDGREISEEETGRRPASHISRQEAVRELTSDSGSGQRESGEEDGSGAGDSEENGEPGKVQVLSKIATEDRQIVTSEEEEGGNQEKGVRDGRKLDVERDDSATESDEEEESDDDRKTRKRISKRREKKKHSSSHRKRSQSRGKKRKHRRRETTSDEATSASGSAYSSDSEVSESEDSAQREKARKQRKKRRRKEKEREVEREMKRKMKRKMKELKEKKRRAEMKKKKKEKQSKKPITTSWGKYGILKDIDMWNKKPEFGLWLAEVKKINTETLPNWEEKQMFKEYMEDYNTATFPSKKYYNLDIYHRRKVAKEMRKGMAKVVKVERTDFNDEDDRRLELQKEREIQKEAEVEALMRKMQSGMAQDMKEQAQLREEMQYQFRLGNTEAAQAIQRRLDPDAEKFAK